MTLKIIGAGFGRTGTTSLKVALERLGFGPCHHMSEIRRSPELLKVWQLAASGHQPNWTEVFQGYQAQLDWPGARYWKELAEWFPQARVILTVRNPEDWYVSFKSTVLRSALELQSDAESPEQAAASRMIEQTVLEQIFDGRADDRQHCLGVYARHIAEVRNTVGQERLLEFDVNEGWEPLCEFLGVQPPEEEFPCLNQLDEFLRKRNLTPTSKFSASEE